MQRLLVALLVALVAMAASACSGSGVADVATGSPAPAGALADELPSPELRMVLQDVRRVAPALEQHVRGGVYPSSVREAEAAMGDAALELAPGTRVGGYRYDPDTIEFQLCIEHTSGAWATYDTAPMATGDWGEQDGCPDL